MPAVAEKPKVDPKRLDFCNLPELPRGAGLTLKDLGINGKQEYQTLCRTMRSNPEATKRLNVVREVLFEIMRRDIEERLILTDFGQVPTVEVLNAAGQTIKQAVKEYETICRWDVREGADTWIGGDGPGRVRPRAGHWKTFVAENWEHLAPLLQFRDADVKPPRQDPLANPEAYRAAVQWSLDDENPDRLALFEWLPKFLENPVSKWTGGAK